MGHDSASHNLIQLFHVLTVNPVHKKKADESVFTSFNAQAGALRAHIDFQSGKQKSFLLHKNSPKMGCFPKCGHEFTPM